jgi:flagellar protein FliO/FliZ
MSRKIVTAWLLFCWLPNCLAVPGVDAPKQAARTISSGDILQWIAGLLIVLSIFFLCAWAIRKLSGVSVYGSDKMRIIGGLSLGMRERVVLLQVGKKQLILGVTPGRIDMLHVLEGDDCLIKEEPAAKIMDTGFAQKLAQVMKVRTDA